MVGSTTTSPNSLGRRAARSLGIGGPRLLSIAFVVGWMAACAVSEAQSAPDVLSYPGRSTVASDFSPDGRRVLMATSNELRVWPLDGGDPDVLRMPEGHSCSRAAFAGNDRVAVMTRYAAFVWHVSNKRVERLFETTFLPPSKQRPGRAQQKTRRRLNQMFVSPDGRSVALDSHIRITVVPVAGGKPVHHEFGRGGEFVWNRATGDALFVTRDSISRLPGNGTGQPEELIKLERDWINSAVCSLDGKHLIITGRRLKVANLAEKSVTTLRRGRSWVRNVAFTKDGRLFTSAYDGNFRLEALDAEDATPVHVRVRRARVYAAAVAPSGKHFAAATSARRDDRISIRIWSTEGEPTCWTVPGSLQAPQRIRFSRDESRLLVTYRDGVAHVHRVADLVSGKPSSGRAAKGIDIRVRTLGERIRLICNGKRLGDSIDAAIAGLPGALATLPPANRRFARIDAHDDTPQAVRLAIYQACLDCGVNQVVWKDKRKPNPEPRGRPPTVERIFEERGRARAAALVAEAKAKNKATPAAEKPVTLEPIPLPTVEAFEKTTFRATLAKIELKMAGLKCELWWAGERVGTLPGAATEALDKFKAKRKAATKRVPRNFDLSIKAGPRVPVHLIVAASDPFIMDGVTAVVIQGGDR